MGLLSTLLKWNELDPPSRAEQLRNDRVCRLYQHNRNPFVDHPEYANLIWKQAIPSCQKMFPLSIKAWINEFHYNNKGRDQNEVREPLDKCHSIFLINHMFIIKFFDILYELKMYSWINEVHYKQTLQRGVHEALNEHTPCSTLFILLLWIWFIFLYELWPTHWKSITT